MLVVVLAAAFLCILGDAFSFQSSSSRQGGSGAWLRMKIDNFDALLFECDGVIAETERDAHRVTFNQAFKQKGIAAEWDAELYGRLLKVRGLCCVVQSSAEQ